MVDEEQIKEWRKYRRRSVDALPVALGVLVALCVILFIVDRFVAVPTWLVVMLVGTAAFSVAGDAINIAYLGSKLRQANKR